MILLKVKRVFNNNVILAYQDASEVVIFGKGIGFQKSHGDIIDKNKIEKVLNSTSSGGVTINDTLVHVSSSYLPFGGVGNSGMGEYHGKYSFDLFSNKKGVMNRKTFLDLKIRYAPFQNKLTIVKKIMK